MKAIIKRSGKMIELRGNCIGRSAFDLTESYGYRRIYCCDFENSSDLATLLIGNEKIRLCVKDGVLYHFDSWYGKFPYDGIRLEEIGKVEE